MAEIREAKVLANLGDRERGAFLALELNDYPDLVLKGGKYIIVHTGLENAEGKLIKRAYSLFAVKTEARQFFLAAAPVKDGMAACYLASRETGDTLRFSGPWGRFHWPDEGQEKKVIAAAFGSGISGILGYVSTVPAGFPVDLYWYRDAQDGLVSEDLLRECVSQASLTVHLRSMQDDPLPDFQSVNLTSRFAAAGEGQRIDRLYAFLREQGVTAEQLQSEVFYRDQDVSDAKADR
jgi:ferredoxin-NADP reductase